MPDPSSDTVPLISQISAVAHETCLYNRVRRDLTTAWLAGRIGSNISAKYKPRKDLIVFRGSSGKLKAHAHEIALIDAKRSRLSWCWAEGARLGAEEPTFAQGVRASGAQRGLNAFVQPEIELPAGIDLHQLAVEVSFASISLLGREYTTFELPMDEQGSIAVFVIEFEGEQPPSPTTADISANLDKVLDDAFNPLASLEGLAESEPGWQLAEINSEQFILRDPDGGEHLIEGLQRYR